MRKSPQTQNGEALSDARRGHCGWAKLLQPPSQLAGHTLRAHGLLPYTCAPTPNNARPRPGPSPPLAAPSFKSTEGGMEPTPQLTPPSRAKDPRLTSPLGMEAAVLGSRRQPGWRPRARQEVGPALESVICCPLAEALGQRGGEVSRSSWSKGDFTQECPPYLDGQSFRGGGAGEETLSRAGKTQLVI